MGLLDILNGMQQGPRGQSQPGSSGGGGGMSPMTMALLGLLAYKAVKSFAGASAGGATQPPTDTPASGGLSDVLGRMFGGSADPARGEPASGGLPGALGGLLGGAATGSVVSGGLGTIIREFQERGYGGAVRSWVGNGPNEEIAPHDLANALGGDTLDKLSQQTGMNRADLLSNLCQHLPELVNQLTPNGRLPTKEDASRME